MDGGQDLLFLRPQRVRVERDRLLHRGQCHQLHQVVLDHVPRRADAVVVAGPAADADVLGHGDLHVVHITAVPDRLVQLVGEAQRQDVLDGFLAQVVVDPEHRVRGEHGTERLVERAGARQVVPERLLDHHPPPWPRLPRGWLRRGGQPGPLQLGDHHREELRRHRQVESIVTARAALPVELGHDPGEPVERLVVAELTGDEPDSLGDLLPDRVPEWGPGVLLDRPVRDLGEVFVLPVAAGEADQREAGGEQSPVGQVVDGRHELLTGQVPGNAEDDQDARACHPGDPPVTRIPQRVGRGTGDDRGQPGRLGQCFLLLPAEVAPVGLRPARVVTGRPGAVLSGGRRISHHCAPSVATRRPSGHGLATAAMFVSIVPRNSFQEAANFSTPSSSSTRTTSSYSIPSLARSAKTCRDWS